MEILVGIGIIWAVIALINYLIQKSSSRTTSSSQRPPDTSSVRTPRDPSVYRPSTPASQRPPYTSSVRTKRDPNIYHPFTSTPSPTRRAIEFRQNDVIAGSPTDLDIKDLVDALTGAPLQRSLGLYQCQRCKVFYQPHSVEVIQSENGGRCVSCQHAEIVNVAGRREQRGRNADVSAITLENYRQYVGHVITFEGNVHTVLTSSRGTDYAVMFENKSWTRGFKMVVFRGGVENVGGPPFLFSLIGHQVRVRGLLIEHKDFGYEIIVSDRAMIIGVQ